MNETKTGCLVCKAPDNKNQIAYRPLVFITGIPGNYSDEDFKNNLDLSVVKELSQRCEKILFRADIHSTSNEVQEEFENLHTDLEKIPQLQFRQKSVVI